MKARSSACALLVLAACSDSTTAIDLELLPSPDLNSVQDLVTRISTIIVIVDAASGRLYPLDAEQLDGDVQIKNADADPGDLELVAFVPMPPDRLPLIRIERGGLPDVPLHIRVLGSADGDIEMARGGVTDVSFVDGAITPVATTFNLLPGQLPITVTEVVPGDGQSVPCGSKFNIMTVFSRSVDAASLTPPGRVSVQDSGSGDDLGIEELSVAPNQQSVTFFPKISSLDYRVMVSTDVTDANGAPLDQVPAMPGLQPFGADFHLVCDGAESPNTPFCSLQNPTAKCPGPPGRFVCDNGNCIAASCDGAACAAGFVCDPTTIGCEVDCRLYAGESCPLDRPACTADGYCVP